jgi:hypothetical protein
LDGVFSGIVIPGAGEMTARQIASILLRLVNAKPGEVNWTNFFAAIADVQNGNIMMTVSDLPGGAVDVRPNGFDGVELESMALRLQTHTQLVEGYTLPNDVAGLDPAKVKAAIDRIRNTLDHKGQKIGDRLQVEFARSSGLSDKARALASVIKRQNSGKANFEVAFLFEDGVHVTGQFNGTTLHAQAKAAKQNAAVRSWLAAMVALNGVDQVNQLLFRQLNDRNVLKQKGDGYEIDEALLGGLAKLWSDILTTRATSVSA